MAKKKAQKQQLDKFMALLCVSREGQMLFADPDFAEKVGLELPDWGGKSLLDFLPCVGSPNLHPSDLDRASAQLQEISCTLQNGHRLLMSVRSVALSADGLHQLWRNYGLKAPYSLLAFGKELYLVLCLCVDHVSQSYRSAAEVKLRSTIGSIIAGFAHEVRNPLAAIVSLAEGVLTEQMDAETIRALNRIPVLVERIENLLKIALSYGRPRPPRASWHKISTLLENSIGILRQAGIELPQGLMPEHYVDTPVYVDFEHITSVITNLIQNAVEEGGHQGVSLRLNLRPDVPEEVFLYSRGALLALDVQDQGGGVPEDIQENIFEPFFTTKSNGTGLGLALAKDLARLNDGEVLLHQTSSEGAVFRLLLPAQVRDVSSLQEVFTAKGLKT